MESTCDVCAKQLSDVCASGTIPVCCIISCTHFVDKEFVDVFSANCDCDNLTKMPYSLSSSLGPRRQKACPHFRSTATLPDILDFGQADDDDGIIAVARAGLPVRAIFGPLVGPVPKAASMSRRISPRLGGLALSLASGQSTNDCNWMVHVRATFVEDRINLAKVDFEGAVYFVVVRPVSPGDQLWLKSDPTRSVEKPPIRKLMVRKELLYQIVKKKNKKIPLKKKKKKIPKVVVPVAGDSTQDAVESADIEGDGRNHRCKHCEMLPMTRSELIWHNRKEHSDKKRPRKPLPDHLRYKYQPDKYRCLLCPLRFPRDQLMVDHALTHAVDGALICPDCSALFGTVSSLRIHIRKNHRHEGYCDVCGKHFTKAKRLENHKLIHTSLTLSCPHCPAKFKQVTSLKRHCDTKQCGGLLTKPPGFKMKPRRHTTEIYEECVFKCRECKIGFAQRFQLVDHMEDRHPDTPLYSVQELNIPMRKIRGYRCRRETCQGYGYFITKELAERHMKRKHPDIVVDWDDENQTAIGRYNTELPYCEICETNFTRPRIFLDHAKKAHPEYYKVLMPIEDTLLSI